MRMAAATRLRARRTVRTVVLHHIYVLHPLDTVVVTVI